MQAPIRTVLKVKLVNGTIVKIRHGDLTEEDSDCIVNAANENLRHGGGVAAAIVRAGGYIIQQESDDLIKKFGPLKVTDVVSTTKGMLRCKKALLHAVGPVWDENARKRGTEHLRKTIYKVMKSAKDCQCDSVAICAISSGIFGFPKDLCASIIVNMVAEMAEESPEVLPQEIRLTNSDEPTVEIFRSTMKSLLERNDSAPSSAPPSSSSTPAPVPSAQPEIPKEKYDPKAIELKQKCLFWKDCTLCANRKHTSTYYHLCPRGLACTSDDKHHLESFVHQEMLAQ